DGIATHGSGASLRPEKSVRHLRKARRYVVNSSTKFLLTALRNDRNIGTKLPFAPNGRGSMDHGVQSKGEWTEGSP
ncbi:MAG: hypothetical protein ACRD24_01510, partial [Terriglobales bacterium]